MLRIVASHPTGNQNVRAILSGFDKNEVLSEFDTCFSIDEKAGWLRFLPDSLRKEFVRRQFPLPQSVIRSYPFRELSRIIFSRLGWTFLTKHETGWASVDAIYHNLDRRVAKRLENLKRKDAITAVYAYEDGALETFREAKRLGLSCIYDLPIAYWETVRTLLQQEAERMPQWKETLGGGINDSEQKVARKTEELDLADVIVTPSRFVSQSLPVGTHRKPVIVSPFGSPESHVNASNNEINNANRPLRVLFVGSMGQRKGLGDLFQAMKLVNSKQVELVVMGAPLADLSFYKKQFPHFRYEAGRPRSEVLTLMRNCDVFCLPSIAEGRALVMQEAMSQGLPLIITPNTGGEDLIVEDKTGFLVPIRQPEALAEKIEWFARNRKAVKEIGEQAKIHSETYSWQAYSQHIIDKLKSELF